MADLLGFDASKVQPASDFTPVPAGKYEAVITSSEMKATKSGSGHLLELTFEIIEGEYAKRLLWARLNLDNPSTAAVEIARAQLSAICRAVEVIKPTDSSELHDLPIMVTVMCKKRADNGEIVNEIKGFSKIEKLEAVAQPVGAGSAPPWSR